MSRENAIICVETTQRGARQAGAITIASNCGPQKIRGHEAKPPAGISLRRVARGGPTIRFRGATRRVYEHGMRGRLAACKDRARGATDFALRPRQR
eukprot:72897-Pyramimonas_sp.AAC.1